MHVYAAAPFIVPPDVPVSSAKTFEEKLEEQVKSIAKNACFYSHFRHLSKRDRNTDIIIRHMIHHSLCPVERLKRRFDMADSFHLCLCTKQKNQPTRNNTSTGAVICPILFDARARLYKNDDIHFRTSIAWKYVRNRHVFCNVFTARRTHQNQLFRYTKSQPWRPHSPPLITPRTKIWSPGLWNWHITFIA